MVFRCYPKVVERPHRRKCTVPPICQRHKTVSFYHLETGAKCTFKMGIYYYLFFKSKKLRLKSYIHYHYLDKNCQKDDPNEDWCAVCLDGGELMCCDKCPKVFHQNCHIPNISSLPDESETWQCLLCVNLAELPAGKFN